MYPKTSLLVVVMLALAGLLAPTLAADLPTDAPGVDLVASGGAARSVAADGGTGPRPETPLSAQAGTVAFVDRDHRAAVVQEVALAGDGSAALASWWLNNERVAKYTFPAGREWEHAGLPYGTRHGVAVDAAGSLGVAGVRGAAPIGTLVPAAQGARILGWGDMGSPQETAMHETVLCPELTCRVAAAATAVGLVAVAAHPGGSTNPGVVAIFGPDSLLAPLWLARFTVTGATQAHGLEGLDVSADGSVIVVTTYNTVSVFRFPLPNAVVEIPNNSQTPARVSADGTYVALGGFSSTARLFEADGFTYTQKWTRNVGHPWVTAVDVADDGTVVAGTFNYVGGNSGKVVALGAASGTVLWECNCYGDYVDEVAVTPDGTRAVAVSWGTLGGPGGDVFTAFDVATGNVLHRLLSGVDEPGSLHAVAISDDGRHVVAAGKAVHARQFGNGGQVYGIVLP
jgi:hypothetical protein